MKTIMTLIITLMVIFPASGREIKGKVTDDKNTPLEYVNVVLYCDSTYINGGITDANGDFIITTDAKCQLSAKFSFIGYETRIENVPGTGDFGVLTLTPSSVELGEVVVNASRPSTTLKGNALVTNVEDSMLAIAGTANDVLAKIPMVVNNEGSFEVFGRGAPEVYINGRKVNDLIELSQLNSQDIKNVEVISNPGAAYSAEVKSVIRIRTKPPKGDGWSCTFRTDNGFLREFRTGNSIDLKYRTGGLEIFANYGWWYGHNYTDRVDNMTTTTPYGIFLQKIHSDYKERYNDMNGKIGFSWMINENHSIGAYYRSGYNRHNINGSIPTEVWQNGGSAQMIDAVVDGKMKALPMHSANLYYNGSTGKLGIDFNADYFYTKSREDSYNDEVAQLGDGRIVTTTSTNRYRMFAEKLLLNYPVWRGRIEVGEEYTNTRMTNLFTANISELSGTDNKVDESNMAVFAQIGQQFGRFNIGAGVRYEHITYDYYEMGEHRDSQSKTYDNLFPSLEVSSQIGKVRMGLNYTAKTVRPGYSQLDGSIGYVNRLTYETGNPYLKPTKIQTLEYMAQWRQFYGQITYKYIIDGVYHITEPYGADSEATIVRTANLDHKHYLSVFVGAQFRLGVWQPRVNAGVMKQWLTLPVNGEMTAMNTPGFMLQWQNAVKLPFDIWLNVDAQLMTRTWDNNIKLTNTPWNADVKLYKGFLKDTFSITAEVKDIFNSSQRDALFCGNAVQIIQKNFSPRRTVMFTLEYRFNTTRDRYRGTGAGNSEKSRF